MEQRVILSIDDLVVKFRVRNRVLNAIRNISFDIYDGETIAIVGESGSGKSVLTKTFTSMLESNGYISQGTINYYPTKVTKNESSSEISENVNLVQYHRSALDFETIHRIKNSNHLKIKNLIKTLKKLDNHSKTNNEKQIEDLNNQIDIINNEIQKHDFKIINKLNKQKVKLNKQINILTEENISFEDPLIRERLNYQIDQLTEENRTYKLFNKKLSNKIFEGIKLLNNHYNEKNNLDSITNYLENYLKKLSYLTSTQQNLFNAFSQLVNNPNYSLNKEEVDFINEGWNFEKQSKIISKFKSYKNLRKLRGSTIATIFQDPMTSLNPLLSVGYQIIQALKNNNDISHRDAKAEAIELLKKVGIQNPEVRMKDLPGKYSGGMRQRVVIAIALACKPKILICDEPTTALDVTIQAQILKLIKELKKEYGFTVIFITHDLGVVANIADRVAIMYAGQIIEYGNVREIFFNPQHPYTWALLSSLPQLSKDNEELFSLSGTPPSLFEEIKGDSFASRNEHALEVDYLYEPPMFRVSETHFAKTWLLDSRSPKIEPPKQLEKLKQAISEMKVGE